ncbi:MAG: short chain dehydrogenase [Proteobacteria bacterium]|nr:MAG: short chain dehydrogenase [Pseudomonadota bacterium]
MREPLAGRAAVVTGAAHGIGRALAAELVARGARVALLDRDAEALESARAALGRDTAAWGCDVTDAERCAAVIAEVIERFGGVDVLVNNAGMSHHSLAADTALSVTRKVMDVNFFGAVHCTLAALPSLRARRGVVVAMSSVAGFAPLVGRTAYAASKHALHGWFDSLRAELADDGVAVMVVCPSFVNTDIDRRALTGDGHAGFTRRPIGKLARPEDIARAVVDGVERRQRLLVPTGVAKASLWLSRLAPPIYERVMRKQQAGRYRG